MAVATDPEARGSSVSRDLQAPAARGEDGRATTARTWCSRCSTRWSTTGSPRWRGGATRPSSGPRPRAARWDRRWTPTRCRPAWTDGGIEAGLRALVTEAERVRRHGFAAAELERAKKSMLAAYERGLSRAGQDRERLLRPGVRLPFPGRRALAGHRDRVPPGPGAPPRHLARRGPGPDGHAGPRRQPRGAGHGSRRRKACAPPPRTSCARRWPTASAGPHRPLGGHARGPRADGGEARRRAGSPTGGRSSALGVTVLTLSNGVSVWLKPTDFKNDQVLFSAYALGGASMAEPRRLLRGHGRRGGGRRGRLRRLQPGRPRQAPGRASS